MEDQTFSSERSPSSSSSSPARGNKLSRVFAPSPRLAVAQRSNYRKHKSRGEEIAGAQEEAREAREAEGVWQRRIPGVTGNKSRAPGEASGEIRPLPLQMELTAAAAAVVLLYVSPTHFSERGENMKPERPQRRLDPESAGAR